MIVKKHNFLTGMEVEMDLPVTQEQLDRYEYGDELAQDVFPELSPEYREFIISGIKPDEWDK